MGTQQALAKVNLALDILGARPDGYHELRMVMQTVSLHDTVSVQETEGDFTLHVDGESFRPGETSMEERAAEAFFRAVGRSMPGISVTLKNGFPPMRGLAAAARMWQQCFEVCGSNTVRTCQRRSWSELDLLWEATSLSAFGAVPPWQRGEGSD